MKSKRCDCVKSEDLRKAIGSLKKLSANFEKVLRCNGLSFSLGYDSVFDIALSPFDSVANGSIIKARECDVVEFVQCWMGMASLFACGGDGQFYFTLALHRVGNGFVNAVDDDFGRGVFIADYGYFRAMLVRCLYEKMSKIGGGLFDHDRIKQVEADVFSRRRLDVRTCRRLKSLEIGADCGSPEKLAKAAQIDYAVRRYKARWKTDSVRQILEYVIGFQVLKFNGKNVSTESGYRDWEKLRPEFRRAIISEGISLKKNNRERKRLKVERERKMRKSKMRFV